MTLLTPLALALSALAVPIVAMYILKLRRRAVIVPSTLLWRRALEDVQANAPWQRLRPNLLLILQLLALLALIVALAQPAYSRSERFSGDLIVIIDESFGMQAHDVSPSRFTAALQQAHDLAGTLGSGNVMSVIGMGAQPLLAIGQSSDRGAIDDAINHLRVQSTAPNFLAALSFASSLSRSGARTRTVVLTSRDSGISSLPLPVSFPVQIVRIGGALRDLGIIAFSSAAGPHTRAVLRLENFGVHRESSDLSLTVDGQLADVRPLTLAPGAQQTLFWSSLPFGAHILQASLSARDDVSADKNAWSVVSAGSTRRVLLVTAGDYFLQTALGIDPSVRLATVNPSQYVPALARGYDLLVFDGWLPPALPATPSLFMNPPAGRTGTRQGRVPLHWGGETVVGTPSLATISAGSPVVALGRYVDLSDVHIARARQMHAPGWLQPVIVAAGTPLLLAGENPLGGGASRYVLTTFNLQESDWPLRISFPLMMQNTLHYLAPGLVLNSANLSAGQTVHLSPPPGASGVVVTPPDGASTTITPPFAPFTATALPGIYRLRIVGSHLVPAAFAVNFFPPRTAPAGGPASLWLGQSRAGVERHTSVPVSLDWIFALTALGVLSAEWWFSFRR